MRSFIYNTCYLAEPIHVTSKIMNTNGSITMSTTQLLKYMTIPLENTLCKDSAKP